MERGEPVQSPRPLVGREVARYSMGSPVLRFLDSGAWAVIRLENGQYAYDPIRGLDDYRDAEGNQVSPNDPNAVIPHREVF